MRNKCQTHKNTKKEVFDQSSLIIDRILLFEQMENDSLRGPDVCVCGGVPACVHACVCVDLRIMKSVIISSPLSYVNRSHV